MSETPVEYGEIRGKGYVVGSDPLQDTTTYEAVRDALEKNPKIRCLGSRAYLEDGRRGDYIWQDNETVLRKTKQIALALKNFWEGSSTLGLKRGDTVAILSKNIPDWIIVDLACASQGIIVVPIYDSYGPANCEVIINSTSPSVVFVASENVKFLQEACKKCSCVKEVILYDGNIVDDNFAAEANAADTTGSHTIESRGFTHLFSEILKKGENILLQDPTQDVFNPEVKPDDLETIVYTSGTSGVPKGAMLTYRNLVSGRRSLDDRIWNDTGVQDVYLSYLPLAHILERSVEIYGLITGQAIGYFSGSIPKVVEDLSFLKPTVLPVVPRVLSKIYAAVNGNVSKMGFMKKQAFKAAIWMKGKADIDKWTWANAPAQVVLKNVNKIFGSNLRVVFNGSAPVNGEIAEFLSRCMNCRIYEGYGLTEVAGVQCAMNWGNTTYGDQGYPLADIQMTLASAPEQGYFITDNPPRGEICFRGDAVFKGYWKDPEASAAVLKNGWFHTGDVAEFLPNGRVKIIDRLKQVFKLQQGDFVHVEEVERDVQTSTLIGQICVYGETLWSGLVGIVVPDKKLLLSWARSTKPEKYESGLAALKASQSTEQTIEQSEDAEFALVCKLPATNAYLLKHIKDLVREKGRKSIEIPQFIYVTPEEFSVSNDQATPTQKLKRVQIKQAYKTQLEEMSKTLR
ncbi:MAG: long-chain acyl-CoA synthetase [Streblomastix strix]|uniref:Long-chain acyl-CoA synthetase n=1 Tax=Streblomastix strix TaxID=222440 RepID=A0A5J4VU69_9EUKA|nr:MAG: long-chain acyl-CoA synthetase [Streblomastix strix]